jgi:hypothetical protein
MTTHETEMLKALKAALAALEAVLENDDPQARTQMEWEQEPLPTIRAAIANCEKSASAYREERVVTCDHDATLLDIAEMLSGEWNSDTFDRVAQLLIRRGYHIKDPADDEGMLCCGCGNTKSEGHDENCAHIDCSPEMEDDHCFIEELVTDEIRSNGPKRK